jgi:hypothetical protein
MHFNHSKDPNEPCFQLPSIYYSDYILAGTDLAMTSQWWASYPRRPVVAEKEP